jgi:hypothetical protein
VTTWQVLPAGHTPTDAGPAGRCVVIAPMPRGRRPVTRPYRRRIWIWDVGAWVLTDDHRVWRLTYLKPAGGAS